MFAHSRNRFTMEIYLLSGILILQCIAAFSQEIIKNGKITGKVIDSTSKKPIEYATISLFLKGNKKPVNGATSNDAGQFTITGVKGGDYTILIESIGYKSFSLDNIVVNKKNTSVDCNNILLPKRQS